MIPTLSLTFALALSGPLASVALPQSTQATPTGPGGRIALAAFTPGCVTTIAELLALKPPTAPPGGVACVRALGYSAANDGGGGVFFWDPAAGTTPDGGLVFASSHPSAPAAGRWTRAIDGELHAAWWGLVGNGTNESAKLQAALNAAQGRHLVFDRPGQFGFVAPLTVPSDCRLTTNGATFRLLADPGGAATAVSVGDRVTASALRVHAAGGFQVRRMVGLGSDNEIGHLELSSANQQTTHASNLDGGLQIRGTNVRLGTVRIANFDYAALCYAAQHVVIDQLRITNFVNGLHVRESNFVRVLAAQVDTPSPNATTSPGHNGFLIETSNDVSLSNATVHDSGEHAFRVGGLSSSRLVFSNLVALRPGQCGFKINPSATEHVRDVQISGLTVIDASATSATGPNEDGLRLEHCSHVVVDGFQVQKQALARSCHVGLYIDSCTFVTVNGPKITDTNSHGIHLQDNDSAVNEITIASPTILFAGEHGVFIDSPTEILRDIVVSDAFIRGQAGYGMSLVANASTVGVNQPVVLDGWIKSGGLGPLQLGTSDPDVHVSITVLP